VSGGALRLATPEDAEAVAGIYAPVVRTSPTSFELTPPTTAEMAERIARTLSGHPWLVCERGGVVCGYAYAGVHRARPAYRWSTETAVYVADGARGTGVGRRMYLALFDLLRRQNFANAFAGITLPNEASVRLHESVGFEPIGVYRRIGYKCGAWHDVGWWGLRLADPDGDPPEPLPFEALRDTPALAAALAAHSA